MFKLKIEGSSQEIEMGSSQKFQESESLLKSMPPTKRIVYTTTRPTDIKTPYEKMLDNQMGFGSPDKRSGGFLNSALAFKIIATDPYTVLNTITMMDRWEELYLCSFY
ncbi:hypothetical protein Ddye_023446 [Dipteronia dyeriana]|uniref:Uncharacterized protein n=1 Tax=Dipteronia dyeriana TaxID=168575 RepID=A0AAD9TTK5_9ROSI|nr:hypothetical protein Ddye_023446 [Dipteronia dyeriana]